MCGQGCGREDNRAEQARDCDEQQTFGDEAMHAENYSLKLTT
jgi:hypothetical protein